MNVPSERLLLLETSGRIGRVGLADGVRVLAERQLDEARRHVRDLAPSLGDLLREVAWQPTDITTVVVSRGPGSYTGLRVGLMSAKAFAYAVGCSVLAIDTFAILAQRAGVVPIEVIEDAQHDRIYCQRFGKDPLAGGCEAAGALQIQAFSDWLQGLSEEVQVTGPGLLKFADRLPAGRAIARELWTPRLGTLHCLALNRLARGERDDLWRLEPLYARPSSAEEQWQRLGR
jgi:tRNA threonylcarbamoyladenosine biosynthesis protein TsaB